MKASDYEQQKLATQDFPWLRAKSALIVSAGHSNGWRS